MRQKENRTQLIIDYDREWTRVLFVESGQVKEASSLDQIDGISGKTAVVLLPRKLCLYRLIALPNASKADAMVALRQKIGDIFPIPASELAFDFDPTSHIDDTGRHCHVYATRTSDVHQVIAAFKQSNVAIERVIPSLILSMHVAKSEGLSSGLLVEQFGDSINIDAFKDGNLTNFRQSNLESLDADVSRLKRLTGDRILSYKVKLDGSEQALSSAHLNSYISLSTTVDLEPQELRTERIETARKARHRQAYLVFAAGFCVTALAVNEVVLDGESRVKSEKKVANLIKQQAAISTIVESKLDKLKPQSEQLKKAFKPAQKISDIMKVASILVPKDAWLTGINLERGKPLQIRGTAKNSAAIAAYLRELTKQKRFRDVQLVFANATDVEDQPVVQFSISAFPVGNLPVIETGKKRK